MMAEDCFDDNTERRVHKVPAAVKVNESISRQLLAACASGKAEFVKTMLENGARPSLDWAGNTALHLACESGSADTVSVLVNHGNLVDVFNKIGQTPLHIACRYGYLDIVQILVIDWGADADLPDMLGMTPLHWAAEGNLTSVVELLLKSGADRSVPDKYKRTAMYIAQNNGYDTILNLLVNTNPDPPNMARRLSSAFASATPAVMQRQKQNLVNKLGAPTPIVINIGSDALPGQHSGHHNLPSSSTANQPRMNSPNQGASSCSADRRRLRLTSAGHLLLNSLLRTNGSDSGN